MKQLEKRAKAQVSNRLRELVGTAIFRPERPDYVLAPEHNLIEGVALADFKADLGKGNGNELRDYRRKGVPMPAKFCAAYSSSALAVNAFAPFKRAPAELSIAGLRGFARSLLFEVKCPNGLKDEDGRSAVPPNLDLLIEDGQRIVAVESKFLEPICRKDQKFSPKYEAPFRGSGGTPPDAEPGWAGLYQAMVAMKEQPKNEQRFRRLDAAQLIKHYLGLHVTYRGKPVTLVYLYWEPANAADLEPYQRHCAEVTDFSKSLEDGQSHVEFKALSYRELWEAWEAHSTWPEMPAHLARLRARYDLST